MSARRTAIGLAGGALLVLVLALILESVSRSPSSDGDALPCSDHHRGAPQPPGGWDAVVPAAVGDGALRSLQVTTDVPGDLRAAGFLLVRVVSAGETSPQLYLDIVGGRERGGWTFQSAISASGWDLLVDQEGAAFRHHGSPASWDWRPAAPPSGFRWVREGSATVVCLPIDMLATRGVRPAQVQVAAQRDDRWLPATFLAGVSFPPGTRQALTAPVRTPERLAFAYQWAPWAIRDADRSGRVLSRASELYGAFGHVVVAAGLQQPDHPSHAGTARLIDRLGDDHPGQEHWGYVSMLRQDDEHYGHAGVLERIGQWDRMGVTGIFLDEFDLCDPTWEDCGEAVDGGPRKATRERQRTAVEAAHARGLAVFANAHSMHGALQPHAGVPTALGPGDGERPADMYLLENPTVTAGQWWSGLDLAASVARFHDAPVYAARTGVRLAVVDTGADAVRDEAAASEHYAASWWRAVQAGFEAHGYTNAVYSATDALAANLPIVDPPPDARDLDARHWRFSDTTAVSGDGYVTTRPVVDASGRSIGALRIEVDPDTGRVTIATPAPDEFAG